MLSGEIRESNGQERPRRSRGARVAQVARSASREHGLLWAEEMNQGESNEQESTDDLKKRHERRNFSD